MNNNYYFGGSSIEKNSNEINHPDHYVSGGIETLDFIQAKLSKQEFHGYLLGNTIKYLSRARFKGQELSDYKKALFYLKKIIFLKEGDARNEK